MKGPMSSGPDTRALGRPPWLATLTGGVALAVAFRVLYLARFGGDPCWMNDNFLLELKAIKFGYPAELTGMPLARVLLFALRDAGASTAVSLGVLYLVSHALLALSILVLARTVLRPGPRAAVAAAVAVAVLPAFAT